jgi:hypothetical protein
MKKVKQNFEIFNFGNAEDRNQFLEAVKNASKTTMISNTSILKSPEGFDVYIYDTRAFFLVQVGCEYYKLLHK